MDPILTSLIYLVVVLAVCGLFLWALSQFPMDPTILRIIRVIVIVVAALFALSIVLRMLGVAVPRLG